MVLSKIFFPLVFYSSLFRISVKWHVNIYFEFLPVICTCSRVSSSSSCSGLYNPLYCKYSPFTVTLPGVGCNVSAISATGCCCCCVSIIFAAAFRVFLSESLVLSVRNFLFSARLNYLLMCKNSTESQETPFQQLFFYLDKVLSIL